MTQSNRIYPRMDLCGGQVSPEMEQCKGGEGWNLLAELPFEKGDHFIRMKLPDGVSVRDVSKAVHEYRTKHGNGKPNMFLDFPDGVEIPLPASSDLGAEGIEVLIHDEYMELTI